MINTNLTQERINDLVEVELETSCYSDREDFDTDLDYYTHCARKDSYLQLLLIEELVETMEEAEEVQALVLKGIAERVEELSIYDDNYVKETYEAMNNKLGSLAKQINKGYYSDEKEKEKLIEDSENLENLIKELQDCEDTYCYSIFFKNHPELV